MCEGFFLKEAREWRRTRALGWIILCGYVDPKNAPENINVWWPIVGDKPIKATSRRITKKYANVLATAIAAELERGR